MKVFVENYNGILDTLISKLKDRNELTDNVHEADCFLLWQDVRGDCERLAGIIKYEIKKPLLVMQHGRGAVRDYGAPNNFKSLADKILVWGESERQRLLRYGISDDKIVVVGCPLFSRLKPKDLERPGKNILFAPVISSKEEPENLLVFDALKIWESEKRIETIYKHFDKMKKAWAWEFNDLREVELPNGQIERRLWKKEVRYCLPRWITHESGLVNVKLSSVHDASQYQAPQIVTGQNDPGLIDSLVDTLSNIDALICLEEGTMQLLAAALNIPTIVVDIFQYKNYGGCENYDTVEKIKTNACYWTKDIGRIGSILNHALANPKELTKNREQICEFEGGINLGNADANIIRVLEAVTSNKPQAIAA